MSYFTRYRRSQIAELRPWQIGDDMTRVSVSAPDREAGSPKPGDMIARNPKNHADQWLVAAAYFADNFEAVDRPVPTPTSAPGVDLDAVDEAERKMTPGPWALDPTNDDIIAPDDAVKHPDGTTGNVVGYLYVEQDCTGIVTLRNAAPALIAEIAALRAKLAEATSLLRSAGDLFVEIQATDGEDEHKAITDGAKLSAAIAAALEAL